MFSTLSVLDEKVIKNTTGNIKITNDTENIDHKLLKSYICVYRTCRYVLMFVIVLSVTTCRLTALLCGT